MEREDKKFDMVSIILLMLIAATSDIADFATALAFPIPVVGQIAYLMNMALSPLIWGTIQLWFIIKLGYFGKAGIINLAGGLANFLGIPGTIGTTAIAIFIANHETIAAIAQTASGKIRKV